MKPFQIVVSSHQNFNTYYVVSDYNTLEEAEQKYKQDIQKFRIEHRQFWLSECYGYEAIIKDKSVEKVIVLALSNT